MKAAGALNIMAAGQFYFILIKRHIHISIQITDCHLARIPLINKSVQVPAGPPSGLNSFLP